MLNEQLTLLYLMDCPPGSIRSKMYSQWISFSFTPSFKSLQLLKNYHCSCRKRIRPLWILLVGVHVEHGELHFSNFILEYTSSNCTIKIGFLIPPIPVSEYVLGTSTFQSCDSANECTL